jgi:type II secretory pathway component PulM
MDKKSEKQMLILMGTFLSLVIVFALMTAGF